MRITGYMYKCDMCGKEQFVSIEEQNDGLLKMGIHKIELAGNSEFKHICNDCYTALIHFMTSNQIRMVSGQNCWKEATDGKNSEV